MKANMHRLSFWTVVFRSAVFDSTVQVPPYINLEDITVNCMRNSYVSGFVRSFYGLSKKEAFFRIFNRYC